MASTNKTTNYELSQFIGTDKPTYLGDYNSDMNKIDSSINTVEVKADSAYDKAETNEINIGELDSLETTLKDSIVDAINEVNTKASKVGNVNNLVTTAKTDTVSAINELATKVKKEILNEGDHFIYSGQIITLSKPYTDFDNIVIGGSINPSAPYIIGDVTIPTDKIILGYHYALFMARTNSLYGSVSFKFNSLTEIEITRDDSSWAGNVTHITYVEGQNL